VEGNNGPGKHDAETPRSEVLLKDITAVSVRQKSSYGSLDLLGHSGLLARSYFTAARLKSATRFAESVSEQISPPHEREWVLKPPTGHSLASSTSALEPSAPPVKSLWRLTRFARPHLRAVCLGFLLTLASTAAGLVPPYLTMPLLDRVLVPFQSGHEVNLLLVYWYLGGLFVAALCAWFLGWGKSLVLARVGEQVSAEMRNDTYAHLQSLSLDFFGKKRTGDLISRVGSDTDRICTFLSVTLVEFSTDLVMIVLTALTLFSINPAMAIVTLLPFPIVAWMVQNVRIRLRRGFARGSTAWAEMINVLADTIPGVRVVKAFAQEHREIDRFRRSNGRVLDANNRVNTLWASFGPTITLLTDLGLLVIWAFGAWSVVHTKVTVGVLTAFVAFIGRLYTRLDSMSRMLASTQRAAASTHRIFEILDLKPTVSEPAQPVPVLSLSGQIEFRHVGFRYGDREVLHDINLEIASGEMVGLVGPSGAGKSTLANLVCRFFDVSSGVLLIDGTDIRSLRLTDYRRYVGVVLQDPFLFFGTIAENIAYGRPQASRGEIIAAARASRAHDFILRLPYGYDSLVGERGQSLSGGERQRISIARALLMNPRILIFDEATSSVDSETEMEIQLALENLVRGRTTIAIAHRMSTLRKADRLIVLEDGQITAIGKHEDLLMRSEMYGRLIRAQNYAAADMEALCHG
jgi:ATP-binding cassette, subfamily B, bacterial